MSFAWVSVTIFVKRKQWILKLCDRASKFAKRWSLHRCVSGGSTIHVEKYMKWRDMKSPTGVQEQGRNIGWVDQEPVRSHEWPHKEIAWYRETDLALGDLPNPRSR